MTDDRLLACARVRLPDGLSAALGPGALIGRAFTADARVDDGRVSEAHAMVSLRGGELVLFALRGRLRVGERNVTRVTLEPGQRIELAAGVELLVEEVELPETLLALEGPGVARQALVGVTSVLTAPALHLVNGPHPSAAALVWSDGVRWRVRVGQGAPRPLQAGDCIEVGGHTLTATEIPRVVVGVAETTPRTSALGRLRIVSLFDSVQVWREGATSPCVLRGQQARLFAELLAVGGPMRWELVAAELWPGGEESSALRHRLDVTLARLRQTLKAAGVRRDLVTAHRNGHLELLLYPGDQAEDRG